MSLFSRIFKPKDSSGKVARNRLKILLSHEHVAQNTGNDELLGQLREEIMEVVRRHFQKNKVNVSMDTGSKHSAIAIEVEVPGKNSRAKKRK